MDFVREKNKKSYIVLLVSRTESADMVPFPIYRFNTMLYNLNLLHVHFIQLLASITPFSFLK